MASLLSVNGGWARLHPRSLLVPEDTRRLTIQKSSGLDGSNGPFAISHRKYTLGGCKIASSSSPRRRKRGLEVRCVSEVKYGEIDVRRGPQWREIKNVYYTDHGGRISASIFRHDDKYSINLRVEFEESNLLTTVPLFLHWGLFRSDQSNWVVLEDHETPAGTFSVSLQDEEQAMRTQFHENEDGSHVLALDFDADMAPFSIGFVLLAKHPDSDQWIRSTSSSNFCIPVGFTRGSPEPLGVTVSPDGSANFAIFSRSAHSVVLCLYNAEDANPSMEIDLEASLHRTGDTWHVSLNNVGSFTRYGYRCRGEVSWENGGRFHPRHILLDPYAKEIAPPVPGQGELPSPAFALGVIRPEENEFDWEGDFPPSIPMEDVVAYKLSVDGYTESESSQISGIFRGTFFGVVEKIDHLESLGVNMVILSPISAFDEVQGPYFPMSFFAPATKYGPHGSHAAACYDLKLLVKELHLLGIEVVLEVVFSHTAEGNDDSPNIISMRGIDHGVYYLTDPSGGSFTSQPGAPNSVNCNHCVTQKLILDSLHHWVTTYHVDGFSFVNAKALLVGPDGQLSARPSIVEAIAFDPILAGTKLIADVSDLFTGDFYGVGFPHWSRWREFNGRFQSDIRRFVRGEVGQLSQLATRLCGSADIFSFGRGPTFGLNRLTSQFGYALGDLVSFTNETELSWGCGEEGPTTNAVVSDTRLRQMKNFVSLLFLSQGVPVLSMGDEYGHSKDGRVDTDKRVFDWEAVEGSVGQNIIRLIWNLVSFRRRRPNLFQRSNFLEEESVTWHGYFPDQPQWENPESHFLAVTFRETTGTATEDEEQPLPVVGEIYLAMSAHNSPVKVYIPPAPPGMKWCRVLDTSLDAPDDCIANGVDLSVTAVDDTGDTYDMQAYSIILLEAQIDLEDYTLEEKEVESIPIDSIHP